MASDSEMELPCPLFEGSEKRIEVEFAFGAKAPVDGLRSLTREQLDSLMNQACASAACACMHLLHPVKGLIRGSCNMRLDSLCKATVTAMYCLIKAVLCRPYVILTEWHCCLKSSRLLRMCRLPAASSRRGRTKILTLMCCRSPACLCTLND